MSSLISVLPHLEARFAHHRLVFWQDSDGDYANDISGLDLPGVTVLELSNNEFAIRHRILKEEKNSKFLLYRQGITPPEVDNWLLDLELAFGIFTADRMALLRNELGIDAVYINDVLDTHAAFFRSSKRTEKLKALLQPNDSADTLRAKMCAVLLEQSEHSMLELTRTLLVENSQGKDLKYSQLSRFDLLDFHWNGVARIYGYKTETPSIDDFILWVFQQAITNFDSRKPGALRDIQLDFASLRNDRRSATALKTLASRASRDLDYASQIEDADMSSLVHVDWFEEVEQKIISELSHRVAERTISSRDVEEIIRNRQQSIWMDDYQDLYTAIGAASELLSKLSTASYEVFSFDEGLQKYRTEWYRFDQLYRHFQHAARITNHAGVLEALYDQVEKYYTAKFIYPLGVAWQNVVDDVESWNTKSMHLQTSFYRDRVEPVVRSGKKKAVVIISDALRFEVAEELGTRIRKEDRFDATLDAMLGVLPSYTQLGMAALLPHDTLAHSSNGDPVLVDGRRSDGTTNRNRILEAVDGHAIQAEAVLNFTTNELRQLYTEHQVIYVYHNKIDAEGDKVTTEQSVLQAAADAIDALVKIVKKLASANATNIFVTADHGFLYQNEPLTDAGYLSVKPHGDTIEVVNRRFVLGRGLKEDPAFKLFESHQLGLTSDLQIQIPKSIHRLRLPGGGSRYVHGGATLQEIVIPVLTINKKRKSDIRQVNVDVQPETDKITTGQQVVKVFQTEPVSEKIQPRTLRAGFYVGNTLISNQIELIFDYSSEDARNRYQFARMLLSQDADDFNNEIAEFRLEEQISNTTKWRIYQRVPYMLRRSFTTDFDF